MAFDKAALWTRLSLHGQYGGYICMLAGASINSVMIMLIKILENRRHVSTTVIICVRMLCTSVIMTACLLPQRSVSAFTGSRGVRWWLLARGVVGTLSFWLIYDCLKYLPMEDQQACWFTVPVMTGLLAHFWLGESFGIREWMASVCCLVGVCLVTQPTAFFASGPDPDGGSSSHMAWGYAEALLGTFLGAAALVIIRRMGTQAPIMTSLFWFACIDSLSMLVTIAADKSQGIETAQLNATNIVLLSGVAVCGTAATALMNKATQLQHAGRVTVVMYMQLPLVLLLSSVVFSDTIDLVSLAGCLVIVISSTFVVLSCGPSEDIDRQYHPVMEDTREASLTEKGIANDSNTAEREP